MTDKEKFIQYLTQINRQNTSQLLTILSNLNFFIAPASSSHHLAYEGGLVKHSLNVCEVALKLRNELVNYDDRFGQISADSIMVYMFLLLKVKELTENGRTFQDMLMTFHYFL